MSAPKFDPTRPPFATRSGEEAYDVKVHSADRLTARVGLCTFYFYASGRFVGEDRNLDLRNAEEFVPGREAPAPKFDPTEPFKTRDGRKVTDFEPMLFADDGFRGSLGNALKWRWSADGKQCGGFANLDLVNTVAPTASSAPAAVVSEAEVELRKQIAQEVYDFMCISGDRQERVIGMALMSVIAPTPISAEAIAWGHEVAERVEADRASGKTRPLAEFRAELEARRLARQPAHDAGQGAEPVAWQWRPGEDAALRHGTHAGWRDAYDEAKARGLAAAWLGEVRPPYAIPQAPVPGGQSDGWSSIESAPKSREDMPGEKHPTILLIAQYPTTSNWVDPITSWWLPPVGSLAGEWNGWRFDFPPTHWRYSLETPGAASTPAPSNAGEDEGFVAETIAQAMDCIRGETPEDMTAEEATADTLEKLKRAERVVLARRGLNAPTRPAGDEVTEAMVEAAGLHLTRLRHGVDCCEARESYREEMRSVLIAALRARTGL